MPLKHKITIVLTITVIQLFSFIVYSQPQIEWYRTYNSATNGNDRASSIAIDSLGNIISCGSDGEGGYRTIKYTSTGQQLWSVRYFETIGFPLVAKKVAVDAQNNIYVTGYNESIVTVKYNSLGILQWVRKYRSTGSFLCEPHDMEIDRNGFIYVTGESSEPFPSSFDFVTIKYNPTGDSLWTRKYNGIGNRIDRSRAMEVDSLGNIYITGDSESLHDTSYFPDITTLKYNPFGNVVWVNRYLPHNMKGGIGYDIALDNEFKPYITGFIQDSNLNENISIIKYSSGGTIQWAKIIDGGVNLFDSGYKIKINKHNDLFISGIINPVANSFSYYFAMKCDTNGTIHWIRNYRDTLNGIFEDMIIDKFSNIYISGGFNFIKYTANGSLEWFSSNIVNNKYYTCKTIYVDTSMNIYLFGDYFTQGIQQIDFITVKYNQPIGIINISGNLPAQYKLHNNYPNPFNPFTNIEFDIPTKSNVSIIVYDILGKIVEEIVKQELNAGSYYVTFDGSKYSSGIYFYKLETDDFAKTKKMVLVK